jgi:uncharacterized Zn finger protein
MICEGCKNKDGCEGVIPAKEIAKDQYFRVGEVVALKGWIFRVKSVKPSELRLKLVRGVK